MKHIERGVSEESEEDVSSFYSNVPRTSRSSSRSASISTTATSAVLQVIV